MGLFNKMAVELADRRSGRRYGNVQMTWEGPFDITLQGSSTDRYQRGSDSVAVEQFNGKVRDWGSRVNAALGPSITSEGIKGTKLRNSIRDNYKYEYGEVYRIGFSFKREGVFVHKGVGRGYVMRNGVVVKISKTPGHNRFPKPWFNRIIDSMIPDLEKIIVDYSDNVVINTLRIYIR